MAERKPLIIDAGVVQELSDSDWLVPNILSDRTRSIYVSKDGDDTNSGLNREEPLLTFQAAIALAETQLLTYDGVAIWCEDGGTYEEDLAGTYQVPAYVTINAPGATLVGRLELTVQSHVQFFRHFAAVNDERLVRLRTAPPFIGHAHYRSEICDGSGVDGNITGTQVFENTTGGAILHVECSEVVVPEDGYGLGDSATANSFGHIHFKLKDLYLAGDNATGLIANDDSTYLVGYIDHLLETGNRSGTVGVDAGVSGCRINVCSLEITADTAITAASGALVNVVCPDIAGTVTGTVNFGPQAFPQGGAAGQVRAKDTATDWDLGWYGAVLDVQGNSSYRADFSGGDARGANAVDLQTARALAVEVASGANSVICGGGENRVVGDYGAILGGVANRAAATGSVCVGGRSSVASGTYSTTMGQDAVADQYGQHAMANGSFSSAGDAQFSRFIARRQTTAGSLTNMYLDGTSLTYTVPENSTVIFKADIVAQRDDGTEGAAYQLIGVARRDGSGAPTAIGTFPQKTVLGEDAAGWDATLSIVGNDIRVFITGAAATTINWVGNIEVVQSVGAS